MGPATILTTAEESLLCKWIIANAKKGFPVNRRILKETVAKIIADDKRKTPFTDGVPGDKWYHSFMRRHPQITEKHCELINR